MLEQVDGTPVGVYKKASNAIPKHLQRKQYLETDLDVIMPPWSPKKSFPAKYTIDVQSQELVCYLLVSELFFFCILGV